MGGDANDRNAIGTAVLILSIVLVVCYMCLSLYKVETPRGMGSLAAFGARPSAGRGVWFGPRSWSGFEAAPSDADTATPPAAPPETPQVDPEAGNKSIEVDTDTRSRRREEDFPFFPTSGTGFPGTPPTSPLPSPRPPAPSPAPRPSPRPAPTSPSGPPAPVDYSGPVAPEIYPVEEPPAVGTVWSGYEEWWSGDDYWCESGECDDVYLNADACCDTLDVPPPVFY